MSEIISAIIGLCLVVGFFGLCVRVNLLLEEIKRQGVQRQSDALKVITLLVRIADRPSEEDEAESEAARLQAAIDARNAKSVPE